MLEEQVAGEGEKVEEEKMISHEFVSSKSSRYHPRPSVTPSLHHLNIKVCFQGM